MPGHNEANPYLKITKDRFIELWKEKKQIEANYTSDKSERYAQLKRDIIAAFIELIKLGVLCSEEEDQISILLDDDENIYTMPIYIVKEAMGDYLYKSYFPGEDNNESQESSEVKDESTEQKQKQDIFGQAIPNYYYPPFYPGMYPPMNVMPYKENTSTVLAEIKKSDEEDSASEILKDILSIQKRVILLEQEKDKAKKEVNSLNMENIAIKRDLEENVAVLNTEKAEKEALNGKLSEKEQDIESTKQSLSNIEATLIKAEEDLQVKEKALDELKKVNEQLEINIKENKDSYTRSHDEDVRKIATLEQQKINLEDKIKDQIENIDALNSTKRSLSEKVSNLENTINQKNLNFEKQKTSYENSIRKLEEELNQQINVVQMQLKSQREDDERRIEELEAKRKELEEKIAADNKSYDEAIENLKIGHNKNIEELNKAHALALEKAIENARAEENNKLADKMSDMESRVKKASASAEESTSALKRAKEESDKVSLEKDKLQNRLNALTSEKDKLAGSLEREEKARQSLEEENKMLFNLAYNDNKTGTGNNNLFDKEFPLCELNQTILALVSISGMRSINESYGRDKGDKALREVADELKKAFPKDSIYRILGDKFIIIIKNNNINSVKGQLIDAERKLKKESINVVYGTAIGREFKTHAEFLASVEYNLKENKSFSGSGNREFFDNIQQINSPVEETVVVREEDAPIEMNANEILSSMMM